jgi:hypothetical protein
MLDAITRIAVLATLGAQGASGKDAVANRTPKIYDPKD